MDLTKYILIISTCFSLLWSCQTPVERSKAANHPIKGTDTSSVNVIVSFKQWLEDPQPLVSAHRGGPYPGFPENAIETFQNISDQISTIIECDVSMTKDSVLILMHDKTLDRTTTGSGNVTEWAYNELKDLYLVDNDGDTSSFQIPTLDDVLSWGKGKTLFTLDVKRGVPYEKVINTIERFDAASFAAIITYRIKDAKLVHSLNSKVIISVSARDDGALEQIIESKIPSENLLGFVGTKEPDVTHYEKLRKLGIKTILGTLGNLDKSAVAKGDDSVYLRYIENGANIIATDRPLEVSAILNR